MPRAYRVKSLTELTKAIGKKSKYNNVKVEIDGYKFDSKAEGAYYEYLKMQKKAGKVSYFLMQVPFILPGGVRYRLDFMVIKNTGESLAGGYDYFDIEYIDVKGCITSVFRIKKKQVEALYPVKIKCVKRIGSTGYLFRDT